MRHGGKVFGLGLFKTGTTSLGAALGQLGYRTLDGYGMDRIKRGEPLEEIKRDALDIVSREHDAFEDFPWFLMHRELDREFPGSKFILTVRDDDRWWKSHIDHFGRTREATLLAVYGKDCVLGNKHYFLDFKRRHEEAMRAYFAERPEDFLELDLCGGEGWQKLCPFLGAAAPEDSMPRRNVTNERTRRKPFVRRVRRTLSGAFYRWMYG